MSEPIEKLLDTVDWRELPKPSVIDAAIPYATHTGTLKIAGAEFDVVRLSDGQRVITAESLERFLRGP